MDAKARDEAERIKAQGQQSLDASRSRTISDLRAETGHRSVELARRIVESSLSDDRSRGGERRPLPRRARGHGRLRGAGSAGGTGNGARGNGGQA